MSCILRGFVLGTNSNGLITIKNNAQRKRFVGWYSKNPAAVVDNCPLFIAAQASTGFCSTALITEKGKIINLTLEPTKIYQHGVFHEMSSNNIWQAMVLCIKRLTENPQTCKNIKGIGFIATSALVCLDEKGSPVTVSASRDPNVNCILSFDQRSLFEAEKINKTRHARLQYFGNRVSPELQESKIMWLKNNLREDWFKVEHFLDLSDFLTWKATGSLIRSSSALLSKWSYESTINGQEGWNSGFFTEIGLPEVILNNFSKLGSVIQRPGTPIASGLLDNVAKSMGLPPGLPVATSMSEALAGGLGIIGCQVDEFDDDVTSRLCIVFDSRSSAHFTVSHDPVFVKGIRGPFKDCILPGLWANQAGQTTAQSVMDYVISRHPAFSQINIFLGNMHIHKYLNKILKLKAKKYNMSARSFLTKDLHILPDFNGNQSPLADPQIRGMVSGLTITNSQESLALIYLATMQSLAYSTRHIMNTFIQHGLHIKSIIIGGDLAKNSLFMLLHKDICQLPTVNPDETRCKLIGAAILGAMASNHFRNFNEAIYAMCGKGQVMIPDQNKELMEYHNKKYQVFLKLYEHQLEYRRIMSSGDDKHQMEVNFK